MDRFCSEACSHSSPHCPPAMCVCTATVPVVSPPPPASGLVCQASGQFAEVPGMSEFCQQSCTHSIPHCPPAQCSCSLGGITAGTSPVTSTTTNTPPWVWTPQ